MIDKFLSRITVYRALLIAFIGSNIISILGNIAQNTPILLSLPAVARFVVQISGNLIYGTVGMLCIRKFVPDRYPYKMELGMVAISLYFAAGETVLPIIMPGNTPDARDIPAVLLGVAIYYLYDRSQNLLGIKTGRDRQAVS